MRTGEPLKMLCATEDFAKALRILRQVSPCQLQSLFIGSASISSTQLRCERAGQRLRSGNPAAAESEVPEERGVGFALPAGT